jgi:hypothetical protein
MNNNDIDKETIEGEIDEENSNEEEIDEELYKLLFNKIRLDDNFEDYMIVDKKSPIEKNKNKNKFKNKNNILFDIDNTINKRHFNPRLPPYNKKCLKK